MTSMLDAIKNEAAKTYTENGDVAVRTTYNANLDFFGEANSLRENNRMEEANKKVRDLFTRALNEDSELAIENLFNLRDIRGGSGERDLFRACLEELAEENPEGAVRLIPYITQYGRYDDLLVLVRNKNTRHTTCEYIGKTLTFDLKEKDKSHGTYYSLMAKWMPSINTSNKQAVEDAKTIAKELGWSYKRYRKTLSTLRQGQIVERNMSEKNYADIDYTKVPGNAMDKHYKAFEKNDRDHFEEYKNALEKGEVKAKTATLYPYQIIKMRDDVLMESAWRDMERVTAVDGGTIVVRDGSGSMTWGYGNSVAPIDIADSLSILFSEQLTGEFKDKFITFSSHPEFVDLSNCKTLRQKLRELHSHSDCSNTDIMKVYTLILNASKHCDPKDYIKRIVIISDMQFDGVLNADPWRGNGMDQLSTYETAKKMFAQSRGVDGNPIPLPEIVYWNVGGRTGFPATKGDNVRFVSGFSQYIIKSVLEDDGDDAVSFMKNVLAKYKSAADAYNKQ